MASRLVTEPVIEVKDLKTYLGQSWVLQGVDLTVKRGEILGLVGGSGSGKSTLLRSLLLLLTPAAGSLRLFGQDILHCQPAQLRQIRRRWAMMFQQGALFSSLTVLENVAFPLQEYTHLSQATIRAIAALKLALVGLPQQAAHKFPSELSGGMLKRAALARALALDPELLFLDEPTAGLDPQSASGLDELVLQLKETLGLTLVIVTHDLDTLWQITDRVAFLGEGKVLAIDTMQKLAVMPHPLIQAYFSGKRAQAAAERNC